MLVELSMFFERESADRQSVIASHKSCAYGEDYKPIITITSRDVIRKSNQLFLSSCLQQD